MSKAKLKYVAGKHLDLYTGAIHPWSERITKVVSFIYTVATYSYSQNYYCQNDPVTPKIFTIDDYCIRIMQYIMP